MNVLILSDGQPYQQEFIRKLAESSHGVTWVRFTYQKPQKKKSVGVVQKKWSAVRDRVHRLLQKIYLRFPPRLDVKTIMCEASDINKPEAVKLLQGLHPDVVITCGAPILKGPIIKVAKRGTFNVHFGISPEFRGNETIYWTFHSGVYDLIGGTFHEIDGGIDTGKIVARVYPKISRFNGVASVEVKIARRMAHVVCDFLAWLECNKGGEFGKAQNSSGKLFLSRHRTMGKDVVGLLKSFLRLFHFRWVQREEERYF